MELPTVSLSGEAFEKRTGSGRIEWKAGKGLAFLGSTDGGEKVIRQYANLGLRPGTVISSSAEVILEAEFQDGRKLRSEPFFFDGHASHAGSPHVLWNQNLEGVTISGENRLNGIGSLVHALLGPSQKWWWTRGTDETITNPWFGSRTDTTDWLQVEGAFGKLAARSADADWFEVKITPAAVLDLEGVRKLLTAVREAFALLQGRDCLMRGFSFANDGVQTDCITLPKAWSTTSSIWGPIDHTLTAFVEPMLSKAIDAFLTPKGAKVAQFLRMIRDIADNSWSTRIANTTIAVEGLLKLLDGTHRLPDEDPIGDGSIQHLKSIMTQNEQQLGPTLMARVAAFLNGLGNQRPVDILYKWKRDRLLGINDDEIKAWKHLRNNAAHANISSIDDAESFGKQLREYGLVLTLSYKLALQMMGYSGKFINRGIEGWADEVFPLVPTA